MQPTSYRIRFLIATLLVAILCLLCVEPTVTNPEESIPHEAIALTGANFDSLVLAAGTVAVVEFYNRYCGTCSSMEWIIDSLASRENDSIIVGAVDTYSEIDLANRFTLPGIPSYLYFRNGELITIAHFTDSSQTVLDSLSAILDGVCDGSISAKDTADTTDLHTKAVALDESSFGSIVLNTGTVAVVEFYDRYCGTCTSTAWITDSLTARGNDSVVIGTIDIHAETDLADNYSITTVPSYLFFKDGELITTVHFTESSRTVLDSLNTLLDDLLDGTHSDDTVTVPVPVFTLSNFDSLLQIEQRLIMIDFFSPTCSHCIAMEPVVADLSELLADRVMVGKVNAPQEDSLRYRYVVQAYPSFLFFSEGKEIHRIIGERNTDYFIAAVDSLLQQ